MRGETGLGGSCEPRGDPRQELRRALVWWAWTQRTFCWGPATRSLCWTSEGARTGQGLQGKRPMKMQPLSSHQGPGKQPPSRRQAGPGGVPPFPPPAPALPARGHHTLDPEADDTLG